MDNAGTFAIATPQIGAAMTQKIISPIVGLNGMSGVTLTMNFKFGSGSGTVTPIVATSLDGGTVWYQIARWDLTNASVLKSRNIAAGPAGGAAHADLLAAGSTAGASSGQLRPSPAA